MNYINLKQAAEATGLTQTTIRRLCKKEHSKPFVRLEKGKNGNTYTIQTNYLFDKYPPVKKTENNEYTSIDKNIHVKPLQDYSGVLEAKEETINILKDELSYLREENKNLREENRDLKLLPAHKGNLRDEEQLNKSFWQRLFG